MLKELGFGEKGKSAGIAEDWGRLWSSIQSRMRGSPSCDQRLNLRLVGGAAELSCRSVSEAIIPNCNYF